VPVCIGIKPSGQCVSALFIYMGMVVEKAEQVSKKRNNFFVCNTIQNYLIL